MKNSKGILDSKNFFVSLITLILLPFTLNGLELPADASQVSGVVYDALISGNIGTIIAVVLPNLVNPLMKWIQNGISGWSWGFIKSTNFWTQALTVLIIVLTGIGFVFPDGAAGNLIDAVFSGEFGAIASAFVINVVNVVYHFIKTANAKKLNA